MTFCINGCGTTISGQALIPADEMKARFPDIAEAHPGCQYRIGTKTITLVWIPILPYETVVFAWMARKGIFSDDKYIELYYPCGKGRVCWDLVKTQWQFYTLPAIVALCLVYQVYLMVIA